MTPIAPTICSRLFWYGAMMTEQPATPKKWLSAPIKICTPSARLLDASKRADGVQIFIGADSHFFGVAGCSVIIAPYQNSREQIVGAIGVIGPTRINYARIIPIVDYTAKMIGRLIG